MLGRSRYSLVFLVCFIALIYFMGTRVVLLAYSFSSAAVSFTDVLNIFGRGLIYDLAFYSYALIPVVFYLLFVPNFIWRSVYNKVFVYLLLYATFFGLGFIAIGEYLFWQEFKVRFNFISVDYLIYRREVTGNIWESYPIIPLMAMVALVAGAFLWIFHKRIQKAFLYDSKFSFRFVITLILLCFPLASYFFVSPKLRAGFSNNYQKELASNGAYQFVSAFRLNEMDYDQFYATLPDTDASFIMRGEVLQKGSTYLKDRPYSLLRQVTSNKPEQKLNVVLITVESLSDSFIGYFGNKQKLTPFLDSLVPQSLFFDNFYATGTRTTRGLEAVTLSIPPTPGRSIVKRLGHEKNMWSFGNILRKKGYDTKFLYGGYGYFENMDSFFSGNGYGVVDLSDVASSDAKFETVWGMADEYLYNKTIKVADAAFSQNKPFFFHIMTTSNHRPYTYPTGRIDIKPGTGREGAVKYTDWAIGDFIKKAKTKPWFNNTIFVILADHQAGVAGKTDLPVNRYRIPMWIYSPQHISPRIIHTISSQIDVAPTVLSILGQSYQSAFFGKDILTMTPQEGRALIGNYQHLGLYKNNKLIILSPQKKIREESNPLGPNPILKPTVKGNLLVDQAIGYYQGAYRVYTRGLNHWPQPLGTGTASEAKK